MKLVEKYRPITIPQVFGQEKATKVMGEMVKRDFENIPNFLYFGVAGTGKTSLAKAFARDLFGEDWREHYHESNASDARKIEDVRTDIKRICSIKGNRILFLDEFDAMTKDAQNALRVMMEKYTNIIFILSCNEAWKIIPAIKSRCANVHFDRHDVTTVIKFIRHVIKSEGIKVTAGNKEEAKQAILYLAESSRGDLRYALNTIDKLISSEGELNVQNIMQYEVPNMGNTILITAIDGDIKGAIELLLDYLIQIDHDWEKLFKQFYDSVMELQNEKLSARLFYELSECEKALRGYNADPKIQYSGLLGMAHCLNQV